MSDQNSRGGAARVALRVIVVAALAAAVVVGVLLNIGRAEDATASQPTAATQTQALNATQLGARPSLLVVTDSIGGGVADASIMKQYPEILADQFGWDLVLDAMGARGYLPSDLSSIGQNRVVDPFIDTLKYDAENYRADFIIVDGGRNDLGKNPYTVATAADRYLTELRQAYPDATIAVITPSYISPEGSGQNYDVIAKQIYATSDKIGAHVIDPVAEGWYQNVDLSKLLWTDGFHLNGEGAKFYADKVGADIERLGIATRNPTTEGAAR